MSPYSILAFLQLTEGGIRCHYHPVFVSCVLLAWGTACDQSFAAPGKT